MVQRRNGEFRWVHLLHRVSKTISYYFALFFLPSLLCKNKREFEICAQLCILFFTFMNYWHVGWIYGLFGKASPALHRSKKKKIQIQFFYSNNWRSITSTMDLLHQNHGSTPSHTPSGSLGHELDPSRSRALHRLSSTFFTGRPLLHSLLGSSSSTSRPCGCARSEHLPVCPRPTPSLASWSSADDGGNQSTSGFGLAWGETRSIRHLLLLVTYTYIIP